jgi:hypothetical protein
MGAHRRSTSSSSSSVGARLVEGAALLFLLDRFHDARSSHVLPSPLHDLPHCTHAPTTVSVRCVACVRWCVCGDACGWLPRQKKTSLMLWLVLALVSKCERRCFLASSRPSSRLTTRSSSRSILFPTSTTGICTHTTHATHTTHTTHRKRLVNHPSCSEDGGVVYIRFVLLDSHDVGPERCGGLEALGRGHTVG